MKLKKSYILLIVMSIFLLISIGSAFASENITNDDDVELAEDGTDVVLSDTSDTVGDVPDDTNQEVLEDTTQDDDVLGDTTLDDEILENTTQEKENTTIETENETYKFGQDSDKNISVQVKANNSNVNINKTDLSVFEGSKVINFEYNNTILAIKEVLSVGNHTLTINYLGSANYTNSSKIITVKVFGNNTIETETSVVCDGKHIEIPVKVYDGVDYIELIQTNFNLTLIYTNETGNISNLTIKNFTVEDGKIKFDTDSNNLIAASLIINYINATEPKTVSIKISTEVKVIADKDKFKSEEIKNISITIYDGQGNLINVTKNDLEVFENGTAVEFDYNNSVLTLDLDLGVHNLTIVYKGDETFNASSNETVIKVYGNYTINVPDYVVANGTEVIIPVTLFDGADYNELTNNFTLNYTYTDENGNVTTISGIAYEIVEGDKIKIAFDDSKSINASVTIDYVNSTGAKTVKINKISKINASAAETKYRFNETNDITITVDGPAAIAKKDLRVFDNGKEITNFNFNATSSVLNVQLAEGVHNLTIMYKGDDTYNASSTTIVQKVYGDIKFNPDKTTVMGENNIVTITVNLNDGADPVDIDSGKIHAVVFYKVGNQTFNETVNVNVIDQNISFKFDNDFDTAYANIKYDVNNLTANTTINVNSVIGVSDLQYGATEVKNFTVVVNGTNGHALNITKDNIKVFKDGKALTIEVNGSTITIKDALAYGVYNLTIKYNGENAYLASERNITLTVYGINATQSADVNSTKKGNITVKVISGNDTLNVTLDDLKLNLTYKNGNDTYVVNITADKFENGMLYFTLDNLNFTTATLNIKYNNTEFNTTINRIYNAKIEIINNKNEYKTGNFTFRLIDVDDGSNISGKSVSLYTTGNIRAGFSATTNDEGIATFRTKNLYEFDNSGGGTTINLNTHELEVGDHLVEISTSGNIKSTAVKTNLTITKANIKIVLNPYKEYYGSDKNVSFTVTNSENEPMSGIILKLKIDKVDGTYYLYTDANGTAQISIYNQKTKNGLVGGDYVFTASNNDTKNIVTTSGKGTVHVVKIPVKINAKDVTVQYNSGKTATIKVTKDGKAVKNMYLIVRLYSTSKKYNDYLFQTNNKGEVTFSAALGVGKHKIIINSADNRYSASQVTKTITVKKASAKLTAKKVTTYYKGGKYLTVKLTNSKTKKPIYAAKINIKIFVSKNRYYNYNGNTGMNGQLKLLVDTLKPKTYNVIVSGADNKNFEAKNVTTKIVVKKAPTKITAKKLTAKKGSKKQFKITVKNKKTKKAIAKAKIKVKVYTKKKAKTYKLTTNSKGIAKLSVKKLKVGKHKVVITSAEKYCVGKAAKSVIKIKK
jgi:hypothetical protein